MFEFDINARNKQKILSAFGNKQKLQNRKEKIINKCKKHFKASSERQGVQTSSCP